VRGIRIFQKDKYKNEGVRYKNIKIKKKGPKKGIGGNVEKKVFLLCTFKLRQTTPYFLHCHLPQQ
jgi:hypothetical protein